MAETYTVTSEQLDQMFEGLLYAYVYIYYVKQFDQSLHEQANGTPPIDQKVNQALEQIKQTIDQQ